MGGKPDGVIPAPLFVAPDGGWGWMIVFSSALSNVVVIPIMQSFGLLFKDKFIAMGMSATDVAIIINVNSAFGMGLGLFNGAMLRRYSFRRVAMAGSLLVFAGVLGLTFAQSFLDFLLMYSFVTSFGTILCLTSNSLALNTYFKKRRGRAAGFSMTATGLGPILMPLLLSTLMPYYGIQGTTLILAGLSLHAFMASLLLHPVIWHVKPLVLDDEVIVIEEKEEEGGLEVIEEESELKPVRRRFKTITSDSSSIERDIESKSMYGFETPLLEKRRFSFSSEIPHTRKRPSMTARSVSVMEENSRPRRHSTHEPYEWWQASMETINLGSSMKMFDDKTYARSNMGSSIQVFDDTVYTVIRPEIDQEEISASAANGNIHGRHREHSTSQNHSQHDAIAPDCKKKPSIFRRGLNNVISFFDLDLLSDPHYVSLMVGMSMAASAEINFSLFTPFIMGDLGFSTNQIAVIMSTIASSDIIFRLAGPYIGEWLNYKPKHMYIIALIMLIIARTCLVFASSYHAVLGVCVLLGIAKGFRTVYMTLVIPAYVPLDRLAAASGIQMVTNGIFIMIFGTLLGRIRDWSGNFNTCIMALNIMSLGTVSMWILEEVIVRSRRKAATAATPVAQEEVSAA